MLVSGDMVTSFVSFLSFRARFEDVDATDVVFALARRDPFRARFVTLFAPAVRSRIIFVLVYELCSLNISYGMLDFEYFLIKYDVLGRMKKPLVGADLETLSAVARLYTRLYR
jgi:hypothetical protein